MAQRGYPRFHARQVFRWLFDRRAEDFGQMSDLSKRLRAELEEEWTVFHTRVAARQTAPDGTDKLLLTCADDKRIECVLMAEDDRRTVCISTQVGCGMRCAPASARTLRQAIAW